MRRPKKVTAAHILVDQRFEADDIIRKIEMGEDFSKLAKDFSSCSSSTEGGDLGSFGKGMMVPAFEDAAFSLEVGKVSGIIATQFGFHIIKRTKW